MIYNIKAADSALRDLEQQLQGCNYVPGFDAWAFATDSDTFTFADLSAIHDPSLFDVTTQPLQGALLADDFPSAFQTINECLSQVSNGAFPTPSSDKKLVSDRIATFWNIVGQAIPLSPPPKTYQYFPNYRTRFAMGSWWGHVYIFIGDKRGFLIAMGAYD